MNKNTGQMILFPYLQLGTGQATKTDEFSEKFQTAFDRLPHFRKIIFQFFFTKFLDYLWHILGLVSCKRTC